MQIFVAGLSDKTAVLEVEATETIAELKTRIQYSCGVASEEQYLTCGSRVLEDACTLCECGVATDSTIDVNFRVLGGKVHGSLARAGKVKGQTPKVAPKEGKKKAAVGRTKRRLLYNKRFVNVVVGPGKKKSPNSQAK
eukprot:CAMPEP_0196651714 /NCGR_PEP_ID=MMETSP1086-20130531/794_1 /TAXON_ID=77921 /ORGANISM="Cyanoptyche  gloeocystis , Strain SAG4.97" /LENGTH=137 /DNA_ID=CAMNT_0041981867 /DNA_START=49 /DNA_END=462 /DNA_ORIENTATION=-